LLDRSEFTAPDYFKAILLGGGPISESLIDRCFNRGIPIISSYGMTESCAQITANPLMTVGDLSRPKKSAGRIFSPNEIEIRTASRRAQSRESGEIWLRGPQLFDGYLHSIGNNKFDNKGWFNTGDFGYLNKNNELFVESRRTDLIISGGENIAPIEVEEALERNPQIREAVVIGIADEEWGQKAVALVTVQADRGQIDPKKLKSELSQLEPFKIPKKIIQVEEIPRSKTGKLLRNRAKKMAIELI
ncbi:MAG TPA: AMP-binding protein, partial [Fodinibius sp.]|nr:AMP-binding protein [Fodinibius sp.]